MKAAVAPHVELMFAQSMLDAIAVHEHFGGTFDPTHPNARPELRRVAAKGIGATGYKGVCAPYRKSIDAIIDRLLAHPCWAERAAEVA